MGRGVGERFEVADRVRGTEFTNFHIFSGCITSHIHAHGANRPCEVSATIEHEAKNDPRREALPGN